MSSNEIGTPRSHKIGLASIFLSWIFGAIVNALMKTLNNRGVTPEELLIVRSAFCVAVAYAIARGSLWRVDKNIKISGLLLGISSVAFYRAVSIWTVNYVIIIIAFTPAVNVLIARYERRHVPKSVYWCMAALIAGIVLAIEPWKQVSWNTAGFLWALGCVIPAGIGFEMWGRSSREVTVSQKCFWQAAWTMILAGAIILLFQRPFGVERYDDVSTLKLLILFGVPGACYIFTTVFPFSKVGEMDVAKASILLQGATPASLVTSYIFLDESLSVWQGAGVACALIAASALAYQMCKPQASIIPAVS